MPEAAVATSTHSFEAIGTTWRIRSERALDEQTIDRLSNRAAAFDAAYSRFRPDSLVSSLARDGGSVTFPPDAALMLDCYRKLHDATDGRLSPLVGRSMEHLGYDADYTLRARPGLRPAPDWPSTMTVDASRVTSREPVLLDFGAAGKGYLADLLAAELDQWAVGPYLVDGSGDLVSHGGEPVLVGLEDPRDARRVIGTVGLHNGALCASATNRRTWGDGLHHIVDARTGGPVNDVIATWVLAESGLVADGLATALFVGDPRRLAAEFTFSYVRMHASGALDYSTNFPGELFT